MSSSWIEPNHSTRNVDVLTKDELKSAQTTFVHASNVNGLSENSKRRFSSSCISLVKRHRRPKTPSSGPGPLTTSSIPSDLVQVTAASVAAPMTHHLSSSISSVSDIRQSTPLASHRPPVALNSKSRHRSCNSYASLSGYDNPDIAHSMASWRLPNSINRYRKSVVRERLVVGFGWLRGKRSLHQSPDHCVSDKCVELRRDPSQIWYEQHMEYAILPSDFVSPTILPHSESCPSNFEPDPSSPYFTSSLSSDYFEPCSTSSSVDITTGERGSEADEFCTDPMAEIEGKESENTRQEYGIATKANIEEKETYAVENETTVVDLEAMGTNEVDVVEENDMDGVDAGAADVVVMTDCAETEKDDVVGEEDFQVKPSEDATQGIILEHLEEVQPVDDHRTLALQGDTKESEASISPPIDTPTAQTCPHRPPSASLFPLLCTVRTHSIVSSMTTFLSTCLHAAKLKAQLPTLPQIGEQDQLAVFAPTEPHPLLPGAIFSVDPSVPAAALDVEESGDEALTLSQPQALPSSSAPTVLQLQVLAPSPIGPLLSPLVYTSTSDSQLDVLETTWQPLWNLNSEVNQGDDESESDTVSFTEIETESEFESEFLHDSGAKWWSRYDGEGLGYGMIYPFLGCATPESAELPLRNQALDESIAIEAVEEDTGSDSTSSEATEATADSSTSTRGQLDSPSADAQEPVLAIVVHTTPTRTLLTAMELLSTELSYLTSLRMLLTPGSTLTPTPPLMASYTRSLINASEEFLQRVPQFFKEMEVEKIVAAERRAMVQDCIHLGEDNVNVMARAFLGAEGRIGSAMLGWCGVVGSFFSVPGDERNASKKSKGRSRSRSRTDNRCSNIATGETKEYQSGRRMAGVWRKSMSNASPLSKTLALGSSGRSSRPKRRGNQGRSRSRSGQGRDDSDHRKRKPSVRDLAILPTQRVMRYVLLFNDLLTHAPPTAPYYPVLEQALHAAQAIAKKCDRAQSNAAFLV